MCWRDEFWWNVHFEGILKKRKKNYTFEKEYFFLFGMNYELNSL